MGEGVFCFVKGFESLGRAKILDTVGVKWKVEYFDSPAQIVRDVRSVLKVEVVYKKLEANTEYIINMRQLATG